MRMSLQSRLALLLLFIRFNEFLALAVKSNLNFNVCS